MKAIRVLIKDPGRRPVEMYLPNTLEAFQTMADGYIETVTLRKDVVIVCNEEGLLRHMQPNCRIGGHLFVGPILVVGVDGEDFGSCPLSVKEFEELIEE